MLHFYSQLYNPRHQEDNLNRLATKTMTDIFPHFGGNGRRKEEEKTSKSFIKIS